MNNRTQQLTSCFKAVFQPSQDLSCTSPSKNYHSSINSRCLIVLMTCVGDVPMAVVNMVMYSVHCNSIRTSLTFSFWCVCIVGVP